MFLRPSMLFVAIRIIPTVSQLCCKNNVVNSHEVFFEICSPSASITLSSVSNLLFPNYVLDSLFNFLSGYVYVSLDIVIQDESQRYKFFCILQSDFSISIL